MSKCNRCGTCTAYCPVFLQTNEEWYSARGRMALLEAVTKKRIKENAFYRDVIFSCLYCYTCVKNCPVGVKVDEFIILAREQYIGKKGLPLIQKLGLETLKNKKTLGSGIKTLRLLNRCSPRFIKKVFLSLLSKNGNRIIPPFAKKSLSEQLPEKIMVKKPKLKVAFFTGCLIEYIYPEIGISLLNLLKNQRIEIIIPKEQYCCGIPLLTSGDREGAEFLARKNIKLFTTLDVDYIINACATCGSTLKDYERLIGKWKLKNENSDFKIQNPKLSVSNWAKRIYDVSEFLVKFTDLKFNPTRETKVTYHDSCHLRKRQGIYEEPRHILKSISSIDFIEMEEADFCCGGGGLFSFKYYDISKKIAQRKIHNAECTKTEYIITGCPGCILHLNDILTQKKSFQKAIHLVELLR
ncbi:(Fe-S)-binding protein [Candidatus Aminicenantes bacterium AC-335-L06]|nr:(Fe-S)-binding protein [Candidatus Aminicenantes bacterium AC-335-L06]